jgi:hypothetical protein
MPKATKLLLMLPALQAVTASSGHALSISGKVIKVCSSKKELRDKDSRWSKATVLRNNQHSSWPLTHVIQGHQPGL